MHVILETQSYLAIKKRCGCLLFGARKSQFYLTLSTLESPAQRKRREYKEGKCNRCNRMQQACACIALHAFQHRWLLSRL